MCVCACVCVRVLCVLCGGTHPLCWVSTLDWGVVAWPCCGPSLPGPDGSLEEDVDVLYVLCVLYMCVCVWRELTHCDGSVPLDV